MAQFINTATAAYLYTDSGVVYPGSVLSNDLPIDILAPALSVIKTADRAFVTHTGQVVLFTLLIANTGAVDLDSVILTDVLPLGMAYLPNSTVIGRLPPQNLDPSLGIALGVMPIGAANSVKFSVTVTV